MIVPLFEFKADYDLTVLLREVEKERLRSLMIPFAQYNAEKNGSMSQMQACVQQKQFEKRVNESKRRI